MTLLFDGIELYLMRGIQSQKFLFNVFFSFFLCLLFFSFHSEIFSNPLSKDLNVNVDWDRINKFETLKEIYKDLSDEYKKISDYWESFLLKNGNNPKLDVYSLLALLDEAVLEIRPFLFQQWAVDYIQPEIEDMMTDEKIDELQKKWDDNNSGIYSDNNFKLGFRNLAASYLAWTIYANLAAEIEQANLIFYEGFESGDLSRWQKIGGEDSISIDTQRKAKGIRALKLKTNDNHNPVILLSSEMHFYPSKILTEFYVWAPKTEKECSKCALAFHIFGIEFSLASNLGQNWVEKWAGDRMIKTEIEPEQWHRFEFICDYENWIYEISIDGKQVSRRKLTGIERRLVHERKTVYIDMLGFQNQPAWVDEIKVSYLK